MPSRTARARRARDIRYEKTRLAWRMAFLPLLALALTLVVEWCNRSLSVPGLIDFIVSRPLYFLFNALIVLTTLAFSELFKRRRAVLVTVCLLWLVLSLVQYLVVKYRTQPFCSVDILMLKDAFSLITVYFTWFQIILMFGGGFVVVAAIVVLFTRLRRRRRVNLTFSMIAFAGLVMLCFMVYALGVRGGAYPARFESLVDAYNDYGFATCFAVTFGQRGISRPTDYSPDAVDEILKDIDAPAPGDTDENGALVYPVFDEEDNLAHPNIILLQLESFFDVSTIEGAEFSRDPTPVFSRLCERFPSGLLYVPTIGGGTANTEFEVLTGLNLDFFGAGEYPYNTILQQKACGSVCYDLKDYGYAATAMHNNSGTFYSRNIVYPNLGFDRFVPLEYMRDMKYNALGWAKDAGLTDEILRALSSTAGRDLVFCISVESHGKYADTYEPREGDVEVLSLPEGIPLAPFQNFVNTIDDVDEFLGDLVLALIRFDEPTIVVAYGDHLPALELQNDMLSTGSVYASRYVIWDNYGHPFEAPDLQAYRLGAHLLGQLGFSGGVVTKFHQAADPTEAGEEYLGKLEVLEYDTLYGDQQAFAGETPYAPTDMILGSVPVTVESAVQAYRRLLVTGENFNEFSVILSDGEALDTVYIDENHLASRMEGDAPGEVCVAQVTRDGVELSRSDSLPTDSASAAAP